MKKKSTNHISISEHLISLGIGLAALYWIIESFLDAFLFHKGTLSERILGPDLNEIWMRLVVASIVIGFGVYAQVVIGERKRAGDQIKASLKEKEILLREIHHRVKNNLQVISSLLNLQSRYTKSKAALEMFKESQNRIKSMALVHERLYQSQDLVRIDFAEYIRRLAAHLFDSYRVNPKAIILKVNIDDVFLGIDKAIPCGLIINELVSNSLKHAFSADRKGAIRIDLAPDVDKKFTLIVSDNGVGFPKDLDFRNTASLGYAIGMHLNRSARRHHRA